MTQQDKRVRWSQSSIEEFSPDEQFFKLTGEQTSALQTAIAVMDWRSRWIDGDSEWQQQFHAELVEVLMTPIDFCAEVANCIENDENVQNALNQYMSNTGQNGGTGNANEPISQTIREGNLIPLDALCTEENKYRMALAVVEALDRACIDFLQIVEVITNPAEYAVTLADNGGALTGLPAAAAETAAWIQDSIEETYEAAYTPATQEAFACAIYCKYVDCTLTFDDIYEAYQEESSITLPDANDLESVLNFLVNVVLTGNKLIVGSFHLMALALLRWGSDWANLGSYNSIKVAIAAVKDEEVPVPSSCACNNEWCWEWDGGTEISSDWEGQYPQFNVQSRGIDFSFPVETNNGNQVGASAWIDLGSLVNLIEIEMEAVFDSGMNANVGFPMTINKTDASKDGIAVIQRWSKSQLGSPTNYPFQTTQKWNGDADYEYFRIAAFSNLGSTGSDGSILRIRIKGTGAMPTFNGGSAC